MSVDLETDVEVLGERLGEAIAQLPEYERFEAAQQAVKDSDEAQEHIETLERRRMEYMQARQRGEASQAAATELKRIQSELHALPVMEDYAEAQQALERRLAAVNDAVSRGLAVDFADAAGSCCHD